MTFSSISYNSKLPWPHNRYLAIPFIYIIPPRIIVSIVALDLIFIPFSKIEMLRRIRELILVTDMAKQPAFIASSNTKLDADETLSTEETLKLTLKCAGTEFNRFVSYEGTLDAF